MLIDNIEELVTKVIDRVGNNIVLGIPLGAGKPNRFVNALYNRVKESPSLNLKILTALSLSKPEGKSLLEKRFLDPFVNRVFGNYPNLQYEIDRSQNKLPKNIQVIEFYFPAGKLLNNPTAQQNYISSNYTHVARDLIDRGVNVLAQLIVPNEDFSEYSLSCNPDVSLDIIKKSRTEANLNFTFVGEVNTHLPYMFGEAIVKKEVFDFIYSNKDTEFKIFSPPKMSVSDKDHLIGLYASTLVKDEGELQIGIGSLGDAIVSGLLLRQKENSTYQKALDILKIKERYAALIDKKGGVLPFEKGLFAASEMFVDSFMHLFKGGIVKRKVYDHLILQRLLNEKLITEDITSNTLFLLLERHAIQPKLSPKDFLFLKEFGIFKDDIEYSNGYLVLNSGKRIEADLNQDSCSQEIINSCLGEKLKGGALAHGGFFLGCQNFYDWLKNMPIEERKLIHMKSITKINQLYGHEELDRLHRKNARFVNTCLMMTLLGGAVSDGLEDGRVVSGVGGQYNFVSMAHALPDGHSIIQLRSTRESNGKTLSSIVFNYGHITIPRHLRDIVITEYGIADLRGKTDSEVIAALIEISDSRFQQDLIQKAKLAKKLQANYTLPEWAKENTPQALKKKISTLKKEGLFPAFPFGTDFTEEEVRLGKALKSLKAKANSKPSLMVSILGSFFHKKISTTALSDLKRMGLDQPKNIKEKIYQKLLFKELS